MGEPAGSNEVRLLDVLGKERRLEPRFSCHLHTWCEAADDPDASFFDGLVVNLSHHGAGLVVGHRLERGMVLLLSLARSNSLQRCGRLARVLHVRPFPSGGWIAGCSFTTPLGPEELQAFLKAGQPPGSGFPRE